MEPGKQTASADEAMKHEEPRQSAGAHAARAAAGSDPGRDACGGEVLPTELCSEHDSSPADWTPAPDPSLPDKLCCPGIGYQTNTE